MSTPVIERPGTPGTRPRPQTRRTGPVTPRIPAQRGPGETRRGHDTRRARIARENTGRAKFVLVVMVLLAVGLIATLWLSTAAAVDSYALQEARQRSGVLTEQSEALRKQVAVLESPASLSQRATEQGLVPISDPARLVVGPDGQVDLVGEPTAATGSAPVVPVPETPVPPAPPTAANGGPSVSADAPGRSAPGESDPQQAALAQTEPGRTAPEQPGSGQPDPQQAGPGQAGAGPEAQEGAEREVPAESRAAGGQG
ncbi:hypothetical protein ACLFMI_11640 [Pseudonocardia nantongensis]|uniref:hypothetical protein n=1 Tax=Pseudonocardia nantongensis TaxID=1181885 RepID=UPI00397C38A5